MPGPEDGDDEPVIFFTKKQVDGMMRSAVAMQNLCVEMQNMLSKACSPDEDDDSHAARSSLPPWSPRGGGRSTSDGRGGGRSTSDGRGGGRSTSDGCGGARGTSDGCGDGRGGGRSTQFPAAVECLWRRFASASPGPARPAGGARFAIPRPSSVVAAAQHARSRSPPGDQSQQPLATNRSGRCHWADKGQNEDCLKAPAPYRIWMRGSQGKKERWVCQTCFEWTTTGTDDADAIADPY